MIPDPVNIIRGYHPGVPVWAAIVLCVSLPAIWFYVGWWARGKR